MKVKQLGPSARRTRNIQGFLAGQVAVGELKRENRRQQLTQTGPVIDFQRMIELTL
jgi:hypothetical protein